MPIPFKLQSGQRLADNDALNVGMATPQWQNSPAITALAGGGLSASTPLLVNGVNYLSAVASANDSVVLPSAVAGTLVLVKNSVATNARVYCQTADTVDGTTNVTLTASKSAWFVAYDNNKWFSWVQA